MNRNADAEALLTPLEMSHADRLTIAAGTSGFELMRRAGQAVFDALRRAYPDARRVALLAGRGNNGGDAYVVASLLRDAGFVATLYASVPPDALRGDAALAASAFGAGARALDAFTGADTDLIVDGLFGAGLSRPPEGAEAEAIALAGRAGVPVLAIDLPSGLSGATGAPLGEALPADLTVTFFRRKPGHVLQPGRTLCGRIVVADIGIDADVLATIAPRTFANGPALWGHRFPGPAAAGHKFDRGHVVVFSGGATRTGAARLAAIAALRAGAGLVTMASPASALLVHAAHLTAVMLKRCEVPADLDALLGDVRLNSFVLGPGFGIGAGARDAATAVLAAGRSIVLDADAITAFAETPEILFQAIGAAQGEAVATPHAGEFQRLFPVLAGDAALSKLDRAREAARRSGAVIVLKGSDTVIAAPDGRAAINETGTPYLATAGSGDVLAGVVAGLVAQGMPAFEAASAGTWMHGRAAEHFGPGLIAEDLPGLLPRVLAELVG